MNSDNHVSSIMPNMMTETGLTAGTPEEVGMSAERIQRVKELAASWVEDGTTPSLVVLAARRGKIVLHEAYGVVGPEPDSAPLQLDSIFPIASITKPITAALAMLLVEDGLLGLNRPVQDYIPEFQGEGKDGVLVHHLLGHTSGIDDDGIGIIEVANDVSGRSTPEDTQHPLIDQFLRRNYDVPLSRSPGDEMIYSVVGYIFLGEIIRRVSGQSLAEYAQQRIFHPIGMNDTHYVVPDSAKPRIIKHPSNSVFAGHINEEWVLDTPFGAGGVFSTAMDMVKFGQMFLNGGKLRDTRVLSRPTVAAMTRNQIPGTPTQYRGEEHDEAFWGYGWNIDGGDAWAYQPGTLMSPETYGHAGLGGVYLLIDPVYELVLAYFSVATEMVDDASSNSQMELFANALYSAIED